MDNQNFNGLSDSLENNDQNDQTPNDAEENGSQELENCLIQVQEWKEKCLRISADLQNYIKRAEKDRERLMHQIQADFLLDILPVVDDVDRAIDQAPQEIKDTQAWLEGFLLIQKKLYSFLEQYGVKEITNYAEFDPELHEAVMQVASDKYEEGAIVQVLQKGFVLNNQVLRAAKVSVASRGS